MALGPLRLSPILRPLVWGGRRLSTVLGRELPPGEEIGESWEIVDLPEASSVVSGGPMDGVPLARLVRERPDELLGQSAAAEDGGFPLLVKLLDAHRMLSVQVHPGIHQAQRAGVRPKTEAWFVLHAEPDARLLIGLSAGVTEADVRAALRSGGQGLPELLASHPARAGEAHLIEAGTLHCLGAGVLLAEVQQPSDTTYRLYDWGRGRPLHVDEALGCIDWQRPPHAPAAGGAVDCPAFSATWRVGGGTVPAEPRCRAIVATSPGALSPGGPLRPGDCAVLPATSPDVRVDDADHILVTLP